MAADRRMAMAHRRLAIIDPSSVADQPMHSSDGRYSIVFNGEIYNFAELRQNLGPMRTHSDTEVLLQLFAVQREAMLPRLRGMFAFCIWDAARRELFMARDPYGIKPLYYTVNNGTFRAASQVKALIAGGASRTVDPAGVAGFLLRGSVPEPFSLYEDIRAVPAGNFVLVTENTIGEPRPYFSSAETWRAAAMGPPPTRHAEEEVREALRESVAYHLVSDVRVGAFLSAGKDSTTIVALAQESGNNDLSTITLGFDGNHADESTLASSFAAARGLPHVITTLSRDEFRREIPRMVRAMDQPTIDAFNTWFVSRAAAQLGHKVMLSGTGGDELFGGYSTFRKIPRLVRAVRPFSRLPFLPRLMRRAYSGLIPASPSFSPKTASTIEYGGSYPTAYMLKRGLFLPWELPRILGEELAHEALRRLRLIDRIASVLEPDPGTAWARLAVLESSFFLRDQLLRDIDWASLAHSIEVRVPLVDAFLLRKVAPHVVHGEGSQKHLLTAAPARPLPDWVRRRPKSGFTVPVRSWLWNKAPSQFGMRDWALALVDHFVPGVARHSAAGYEQRGGIPL